MSKPKVPLEKLPKKQTLALSVESTPNGWECFELVLEDGKVIEKKSQHPAHLEKQVAQDQAEGALWNLFPRWL